MKNKSFPFSYLGVFVLLALIVVSFIPPITVERIPLKTATLSIKALDGHISIAQAKKVFKFYLDPNFRKWGLDQPQKKTKETSVQIYQVTRSFYYSSYHEMFTALSSDLDSLCLTQNQIIEFCKEYPEYLAKNRIFTFFLFKENNEYFTVAVVMYFNRLTIRVRHLKDRGSIRFAGNRQIVVPSRN